MRVQVHRRNPAGAAVVSVPAFAQGIADWGVRAMSGSYTPSNGKETMYSTLVGAFAEWHQTGQSLGADNVFNAWGHGMHGDPDGLRGFVHGGGHLDSGNNGLYIYDFSGDAAPVGWKVSPNTLSTIANATINSSNGKYADGRMCSIHAYAMWFDKVNNQVHRVSGSPYSNGGGATDVYGRFNLADDTQTSANASAVASLGATLIGKADGTKLLYLNVEGTPQFINTSTLALTASGSSFLGSTERGPMCLYDVDIDKHVCFFDSAGAKTVKVITTNWGANTFSVADNTMTGANASDIDSGGACLAKDRASNRYLVVANKRDATNGLVSSLYSVNPSTWAVTKFDLGSTISISTASAGGYGKCVWFESWRILAVMLGYNDPVQLIKVPIH